MKKQTKLVAVLSTAALLAIGASMTSFAATGWAEEDGTWVYYDRNGDKVTDKWAKSGNNWYYLDSNGEMAVDTLIEDGDNYYYVDVDGVMAANQWVAIDNEDAGQDDEPEHYWYYFQANGKALKQGDNSNVALKTINGKKYAFDVTGAMVAEWSLDKEKASDNLATTNFADYEKDGKTAKYSQAWRYFNSVEDGSRVSKGWFKVVAAEYLNKSKYDDDEDAWYYADGSGNIYAGEFKTIKGKKYAFRTDGRMINGLKFIQKDNNGKITDVKADDDDPNFDTEDDFINHAISFYLKNNYECYYFGGSEDGAMRTNKTNITIDGDNFNFYFEKSGSNKGAGLTGEKDDKYYLAGMLVKAGSDEKYQVVKKVTLSNGKVAYQKIADAKKFLDSVAHTTPSANSDGKVTIGGANTGAVTKKSDDLKEAYDITTPSADYFLVNTSGSVVDKKSKSKDGDDYVFVTGSKGVIIGVYVED